MKLIWKILIGIAVFIIALFLLIVGLAITQVISEASYRQKAVWRSNVMFASPIFYEDLKNCSLAYTGEWEIKGLKQDKCNLWFVYDTKVNYEQGTIRYIKSFCSLPKEAYSSEDLDWDLLIEEGYCYLDYNYSEEEKSFSEPEENYEHPSYWDLNKMTIGYIDYLEIEGFEPRCNNLPLKNNVNSNHCLVTDINTKISFHGEGDFQTNYTGQKIATCKEICLSKEWLATLDPDKPVEFLIYYDFNKYGANPKVIQTELLR